MRYGHIIRYGAQSVRLLGSFRGIGCRRKGVSLLSYTMSAVALRCEGPQGYTDLQEQDELVLVTRAYSTMKAMDKNCWMWEHRADPKEAEGCCIERATASEYIHNQMSKQVTNRVT